MRYSIILPVFSILQYILVFAHEADSCAYFLLLLAVWGERKWGDDVLYFKMR